MSGASDAQTDSSPGERESPGAEQVLCKHEAAETRLSPKPCLHDQRPGNTPDSGDHRSLTTPGAAPSLTDTSGGRGSHTAIAQSRPVTPSGDLPVISFRLASPPRASPSTASLGQEEVIPDMVIPGTDPMADMPSSTNGELHGDQGLQDKDIDYSLLDGLQYDFAEFHPEPPSFPPSMVENLLRFPHLSPMELSANGTPQQLMEPIAEAPLDTEHATGTRAVAHLHVSTSASQRAPPTTVPIELPPDLASRAPPQSLPAPQVAALPSPPPETTQALNPSVDSTAPQAPTRASATSSQQPQHSPSASLSAAIAGAYLRLNGASPQQASNPVNAAVVDEAPAVDLQRSVEEPHAVTERTHGDPAPTSAQSNPDDQEAPASGSMPHAELDASAQAGTTGGRARRERRPRVNPDGTVADGPGTGRYAGGGESGTQEGLAPGPSSKKRANKKQGGSRATKRKR